MRDSIFDMVGNLETLLAVALGAVLATSGALVAELVQDRLNRRRRERDAARFFGEIMSSTDRILERAISSRTIGEAWGPVTRRLFKIALREAAVYERNRERLFDIRDVSLRNHVHTHMLTTMFPVDAICDYAGELDEISDALRMEDVSESRRERLKERASKLRSSLDAALTTVQREMKMTPGLCDRLEKIARVDFTEHATNRPDGPDAS